MSARLRKPIVIAATVLALVSAVSVETALAKKNKVVATINGKRFKWKGRFVVASFSGNGTIIVATKPARPGKIMRTFGFGCAIFPPNETFPLTPSAEICNANYTETRVSGANVSINGWLAVQGVQVTYSKFEGGRLEGTVSAVLDPLPGSGLAAVAIEGTFNTSTTQSE